MNALDFTFSDLISGYVTSYDAGSRVIELITTDRRPYRASFNANTYARQTQNLNEGWIDCGGKLDALLVPGQLVFLYGTFFPEAEISFEINYIVFAAEPNEDYRYLEPGWWVTQIDSIASSYLKWQFGFPGQTIDYKNYRTLINLSGAKQEHDYLQETDTISRMVYGMASAYMLTGKDEYLEAAEKGSDYLRDKMRFVDSDTGMIYWYHGMKVSSGGRNRSCLYPSSVMTMTPFLPTSRFMPLLAPHRPTVSPAIRGFLTMPRRRLTCLRSTTGTRRKVVTTPISTL